MIYSHLQFYYWHSTVLLPLRISLTILLARLLTSCLHSFVQLCLSSTVEQPSIHSSNACAVQIHNSMYMKHWWSRGVYIAEGANTILNTNNTKVFYGFLHIFKCVDTELLGQKAHFLAQSVAAGCVAIACELAVLSMQCYSRFPHRPLSMGILWSI